MPLTESLAACILASSGTQSDAEVTSEPQTWQGWWYVFQLKSLILRFSMELSLRRATSVGDGCHGQRSNWKDFKSRHQFQRPRAAQHHSTVSSRLSMFGDMSCINITTMPSRAAICCDSENDLSSVLYRTDVVCHRRLYGVSRAVGLIARLRPIDRPLTDQPRQPGAGSVNQHQVCVPYKQTHTHTLTYGWALHTPSMLSSIGLIDDLCES